MAIKQAVILAGGLGKRLAPFTDNNPKPMYPIHGIPFIGYLLKQLQGFDIHDVVLLLGYKAEKIQEYLGDGSKWGVSITYLVTPTEFETGSRLREACSFLKSEFLLMYCDNYCPIDFTLLMNKFYESNADILLSVYSNNDGYTRDNIRINYDGKVECYDKKRIVQNLKGVDIGYAIIKRKVLELIPATNCNFEEIIYPILVKKGTMYATLTHHRYYSIGSWERIELTKHFFQNRKVIFLDRDGTLNKRPPRACYVECPEEFKWLSGAKEAISLLKENGYEIYLVSNQPGIARGNLTEDMLSNIHEKMLMDLRDVGGEIDDIYYCPHNWNEGCFCRKPQPGLFYQAQQEHAINLAECLMIGDDERDMEAAAAAGIKGLLITEDNSLLDCVKQIVGKEL